MTEQFTDNLITTHLLVLSAHQSGFLLRAALLSVLLCSPRRVASDSDEGILTDWEIWKSSHGVSYDDLVRLTPPLKTQGQT